MAQRRLGLDTGAFSRLHRIQARGDRPSGTTAHARFGPRGGPLGRRRGNGIFLAGAIVLVALTLAGCSSTTAVGPSTTSIPTSTTTPPTSRTTPPTAATEAVLAAYRAGWAAYEHAGADANPLDPALAATMVNPLLHQVEGSLVADNQEGIVGQGPITLHPHVASVTAASAVVLDCSYSASFLVYKKTGKQVPPITKAEEVGVKATLVLDGTTWKVKSQTLTEGSCPAGY